MAVWSMPQVSPCLPLLHRAGATLRRWTQKALAPLLHRQRQFLLQMPVTGGLNLLLALVTSLFFDPNLLSHGRVYPLTPLHPQHR